MNANQRCLRALEALLKQLGDEENARDKVKQLEKRLVSPAGILEADVKLLSECGLTEGEAQLVSLLPGLARFTERTKHGLHPVLDSRRAASEYLKSLFLGVGIEQFYLLCLDESGRMLTCKLLQNGTVDETPFYLSHLLRTVVTTNAQAVVLCHNHPGGTLRPSEADQRCTVDALNGLYPLRVQLLDHIIIAAGEAVSIRDLGLIPSALWRNQAPDSSLLQHWLDD